jgi:hypothetical protein
LAVVVRDWGGFRLSSERGVGTVLEAHIGVDEES